MTPAERVIVIAEKQTQVAENQQRVYDAGFKKAIERYAPEFTESGAVVNCEPVEGYPLDVVSQIVPVQAGSGDPSPDNIRPITGHTQVKLTQCGKNLLQLPAKSVTANGGTISCDENGLVTISGTPTGYVQMVSNNFVLPLGELTLTARGNATNISGVLQFRDVNENILGSLYIDMDETHTRTFDLSSVSEYDHCTFTIARKNNNVEMTGCVYFHIGNAAPAEFSSAELGQAVYAGTFDWSTGLLTLTHKEMTITGNESGWIAGSDHIINYNYCNDSKKGTKTLFGWCSHMKSEPTGSFGYHNGIETITKGWAGGYLRIGFSSGCWNLPANTADEMLAYLKAQAAAGTPLQIVYQLETPITVQLTPTEILALSGTNTIQSNTGDTTVTGKGDGVAMVEELKDIIISLGGEV
jgi:hypothetical protein